ncbi:tubulin epsilon and delta complex protein 1 isoform X1 [Conger conger]|uniref:tubulin epsilon and delta complex protein 1 isoform X1 n=1 Tax=Conger conger TaxID=82655 RepID=UPI002A5ACEEF|nr:tubulin epsilon and delta complex protein 1 isoform X1 [Conger conger]
MWVSAGIFKGSNVTFVTLVDTMQRGKSVKIKEVIESLCKLLSALGVDSVPGTDTFRRAKFNKGDAEQDLWRLLYSLLFKAVQWECACQTTQEDDVGAQARLVSGMLWQLGYGAPWLAGTRGEGGRGEEAGSRDLLLALGWVISSGNLLEALLGEQAEGLETLTNLPGVPDCRPGGEHPVGFGPGASRRGRGLRRQGVEEPEWEEELRRLQWEQGKLHLLWRSLGAAQAERACLLHQVLSSTNGLSDTHPAPGHTGHNKELERLQTDIQLLEIYLDWKQMEPLFWSWMESVIDTRPAEPSPPSRRGAVAMALKNVVVKGARCQGDSGRRGPGELSESLLMLQVRLNAWRVELENHASPLVENGDHDSISNNYDSQLNEDVISSSEKAKIRERVKLRLRGLAEAYTSQSASRRFRLRPPEHPTHRTHRPTKDIPSRAGRPIEAQASRLIEELREEEAGLRQEVARLRRDQREELQELASRLEGVVLIPPLKRRGFVIGAEK